MSTDNAGEKKKVSLRPNFGGMGGGMFGPKQSTSTAPTTAVTAGGFAPSTKSTPFMGGKKKEEVSHKDSGDSKCKYDRNFMSKFQNVDDVPVTLQKTLSDLPHLASSLAPEMKNAIFRKGGHSTDNSPNMRGGNSKRGSGRGGRGSHEESFGRRSENPYTARLDFQKNEKDQILRSLTLILNKMTPENFSRLTVQICDLMKQIEDEKSYRDAVGIIYFKAVSEPSFSKIYSDLCVQINDLPVAWTTEKGKYFRTELVSQCQEEFENQGRKVDLPTDPEEMQMAKDKIKRRNLGNVNFIGELFKVRLISEKIVQLCANVIFTLIERAKQSDDKESMEFQGELLCKLLKTTGKSLDGDVRTKGALDECFATITKYSTDESFSHRLRFFFLDLVELRANAWVPRREESGPKKLSEIEQEARDHEKQMENEFLSKLNLGNQGRAPSDSAAQKKQSKVDDEKFLSIVRDHLSSPGDTKAAVAEAKNLSKTIKSQKMVELAVTDTIDKKESDIVALNQLFFALAQAGVLFPESFSKGFRAVVEALPDLSLDIPYAPKNLILSMAHALSDRAIGPANIAAFPDEIRTKAIDLSKTLKK